MELSTIQMPKEQAEERLKAYKAMLATERTDQDRRIQRGYETLARGLTIIELSKSIHAGGYFDNGLPKIAIGRADSQDCWIETNGRDLIYYIENPRWREMNRGALVNALSVRVTVPEAQPYTSKKLWSGHTIMPIIPPEHRPKINRLHLFHILWEVEKWDLVPPKDPALLRWIGGDLWEVVATWDLTPLEQAVLSR